MTATIALLTDFGTHDAYVGTMKGVMLEIAPTARLVDLTHDLPPQDLRAAAYSLWTSHTYFPSQTIFCCVVDPGVGSTRRSIGVRVHARHSKTYFFIAPDNGLLTPTLRQSRIEAVHVLDDPRWHLDEVTTTFHGRDIFAPAAAHLAAGQPLAALGSPADPRTLVRIDWPQPQRTDDGWSASIIHIDHFGNLVTNLPSGHLDGPAAHWQVRLGDVVIPAIARTFSDAAPNAPVAYIGSSGLLELAIRNGNARQAWSAKAGQRVTATRHC